MSRIRITNNEDIPVPSQCFGSVSALILPPRDQDEQKINLKHEDIFNNFGFCVLKNLDPDQY